MEDTQLPAGQYILRISSCRLRESMRGTPHVTFHSVVDEGPHEGKKISFIYNTGPYGYVLLKSLIQACDMPYLLCDRVELESFEDRVFVAEVTYGAMGLRRDMPFVKPALLSFAELRRRLKAIREGWREPPDPKLEPTMEYNPADNVVPPHFDTLEVSGEPWEPMGQVGGRFRSDQPNMGYAEAKAQMAQAAQPDPAYCQCASPSFVETGFTSKWLVCTGCGKEKKA